MDADGKGVGQRTGWSWTESMMVSDYGRSCKGSRTTYELEVERECDKTDCSRTCKGNRATYLLEVERKCEGVRLWTHTQREQDNV
jgi:hypothetical protein